MNVKSERKCERCGNILDTAGTRGLCLSCLSMSTSVRFSSAEAEVGADDLVLEQGLAVGPQDRFLLHDKLGAGGMGEVWLATDQELSREDEPYWVALKFLSPSIRNNKQALAAVRTEVIRSQELNHPNIVRVFDLHTTKRGMPFIKMEYVKGHNLVWWLEESQAGVLHWREVVEIAQQLCGALQYAHETAGVIHRDIKPGNLMLRKDRILKVADFGIAEAMFNTRAASMREKGLGTIWYASPQQLVGQKPTPADDIHALGATLYELIAGEPPFLGDTTDHSKTDSAEALIHQVRFEQVEPLRQRLERRGIAAELPPKLASLIHRCLEKDAQARPLAREVLALLPSMSSMAQQAAPAAATPPKPKLKPAAIEPVPEIPAERWEAPVEAPEKSGALGKVLGLAAFVLIAAASAYFGFKYVSAKGPRNQGAVQQQQKSTNEVRAGGSEDPIRGLLEVDLSEVRNANPRLLARTITVSTTGGTVVTQRLVEATSIQSIIPLWIERGEYIVSVKDADGAERSDRATIQPEQSATVRFRPSEVVRMGSVIINLRGFAERRRPRTIVIKRLDGGQEEIISAAEKDLNFVRRIPAGSYEVSVVETFNRVDDKWTVSAPTSVVADRTNRVVLESKSIFVTLRSNLPDTLISWPEGLAVTNSVMVGASREETVLLPMGTFPIRASKPGGWLQKPSPQVVTITEQSKLVTVNMRFSSAPRPGIGYWTNSLDMTMWEIPSDKFDGRMKGGWLCTMETRVSDFAEFVRAKSHDMSGGMYVVTSDGVKLKPEFSWANLPAGFDRGTNLPVVGVSWDDARKFCEWLTAKEMGSGELEPGERYRLPTAREWAELAGGHVYPWGDSPYSVSGNYSGKEVARSPGWPGGWLYLKRYEDRYPRLAPAEKNFAGAFGLLHMGGNAAEWTEDRMLCGGSWADGAEGEVANDFDYLRTDKFRTDIPIDQRHDRIGFRVYLETNAAKEKAL